MTGNKYPPVPRLTENAAFGWKRRVDRVENASRSSSKEAVFGVYVGADASVTGRESVGFPLSETQEWNRE